MTAITDAPFELAIRRTIDAPVAAVWRAWTDHLTEWWCPRPWRTEVIEHDLRPGGRSAMVMHGPAGERHEMEGVVLEVVPLRRIVFTDAFRAGWIPQKPFMLGFFDFTDLGAQTGYHAGARHWDAESYAQHQAMGFEAGWSAVADQLEQVARRIAGSQAKAGEPFSC